MELTICRAKELDTIMASEASDQSKDRKKHSMRKAEANFLRFLRTSEKPSNYATLKIIGKGAFGEVRLVQRRHDGRIYALKSLIKQEMVSRSPAFFWGDDVIDKSYSTRRISWHTFVLSVTFLPTLTAHGW